MGKQNDIVQGVNQGLDLALRIVEKEGIEELRKTIEFRNVSGCSLNVSRRDLLLASEQMKFHSTQVAIAISLVVLREEFCFSNYQMHMFDEIFDNYVKNCCEDPRLIDELYKKVESVGIDVRPNKED